jgi:hypothetical protein
VSAPGTGVAAYVTTVGAGVGTGVGVAGFGAPDETGFSPELVVVDGPPPDGAGADGATHDPPDVAMVAVDTTGEAVAVVGRFSFASAPVAPELESVKVSVLPVAAMVTLLVFDVPKSAVPEEEIAGSRSAA